MKIFKLQSCSDRRTVFSCLTHRGLVGSHLSALAPLAPRYATQTTIPSLLRVQLHYLRTEESIDLDLVLNSSMSVCRQASVHLASVVRLVRRPCLSCIEHAWQSFKMHHSTLGLLRGPNTSSTSHSGTMLWSPREGQIRQ